MHLLILFISVLSIGIFGANTEIAPAVDKCLAEAGAVRSDLVQLFRGENIPKLRCFWACTMKAEGTMNADGVIDMDKEIAEIPPDEFDRENIVKALKACEGEKGTDSCDTGNRVHKCIMSKL